MDRDGGQDGRSERPPLQDARSEQPPFLTWNALYALVILALAAEVAGFALLTATFR